MRARRPARALAAGTLLLAGACGGEAPPAQDETPATTPAPAATAPPGTDIWLADLGRDAAGGMTVTGAVNVTDRPGYDNQPAFLPDGSAFYYTVADDAGQADIWLHDLADGSARAVTRTAPESEYSGTPLPGGGGFSAVRVEADSTQRLWRFDADGGDASVLLPDLAPVGYHAWVGSDVLVLYVLGDPATLRVATPPSGDVRTVASDVGRSIQPIPGTSAVSYVQRLADGGTEIRRLDPASGTSELIVAGLQGGDFHAWTPDGILLQALGSRLFAFRPGVDGVWTEVADLAAEGIQLSRIAVAPDGARIALVGEPSEG